MSLDVYLLQDCTRFKIAADYLQDGGFDEEAQFLRDYSPECYYDANITHNLNRMADEAGIYEHLWRPEEIGIYTAQQLIEPLKAGLKRLEENPDHYKKFDPENGWGTYGGLVRFVEEYLEACIDHPQAVVEVSR